jgi:hypothetical protein
VTRVALGDSRLAFVAELDAWLVKRQADAQEVLRRPDNVTSENTMILDIPPSPAVLASCPKGGRALPDRYFIRDRRSNGIGSPCARRLATAGRWSGPAR